MLPDPRQTYRRPSVVDYYDREQELQEAEKELLAHYLRDGMAVLDIGVGAGRTTRYVAPRAGRYVGLDYSDSMVKRSRRRFPGLSFLTADAAVLPFRDGSFDLALFSFNGLGCLPGAEARRRCLAECRRVLRPAGVLLLSLHNARFLFTRPSLGGVGPLRALWRLAYAAYQSARNLPHRLPSRAWWRGAGYVLDPAAHGGMHVYVATPALARAELESAGFRVERCLPAPEVRARSPLLVPWYYYACTRAV